MILLLRNCWMWKLVFQLLLKLIVDHLAEFSAEPGVFTMFSEQLKKTYFNILIKPERLGKYVSHSHSSGWSLLYHQHQRSQMSLMVSRYHDLIRYAVIRIQYFHFLIIKLGQK